MLFDFAFFNFSIDLKWVRLSKLSYFFDGLEEKEEKENRFGTKIFSVITKASIIFSDWRKFEHLLRAVKSLFEFLD